jgi:allantoate deiminase
MSAIETIAKRRELELQADVTHENHTAPCAPWLRSQLAEAIAGEGFPVLELPSGAGHDGMAMIDIADVGMLFVQCRAASATIRMSMWSLPTSMPRRVCCCG